MPNIKIGKPMGISVLMDRWIYKKSKSRRLVFSQAVTDIPREILILVKI